LATSRDIVAMLLTKCEAFWLSRAAALLGNQQHRPSQ
jgi:hypothetical protein